MNISTFYAFKSRNYRLYFTGQSISLIGTWMQKTAVSWIVYSLTHSEFMLGLTLFASLFPSFIFSILGGVVADRYNRHRVLLITQIASMIQALALTVLVYFKHYQVWEIIALSTILGIINAFDVPARQSLVVEMIDDKEHLPNAVALNSSMVNLTRLIGPGIAGLLIEKFGDVFCFGLNTLSFAGVIASLMMMRLPAFHKKEKTQSALTEIKEGFVYIKRTPELGFILLMLCLMSLLVLPFITLIPVYAQDIFHGTASTFGIIDSMIGLGAFAGAIFLASLGSNRDRKFILAINTLVLGAGLILFSHEGYYPLALLFAVISGFGMMSQVTISNTIIQTTVQPDMRGRVISFYAMVLFGMQPVGGLLVGFISQYINAQNTLLIEGIIALIAGGVHLWVVRSLRNKNKQNALTDAIKAA